MIGDVVALGERLDDERIGAETGRDNEIFWHQG
jgi:hypothetical protein